MKNAFLSVFCVTLGFSSMADAQTSAVCELSSRDEDSFFVQPFGKLLVGRGDSQLAFFDSREEAVNFRGADDANRSLVTYVLEETRGRDATFANPTLEEAKRRADGAMVFKIRNDILSGRNRAQQFDLKIEYRDYDDDYTGLFYLIHGYVVHSRAKYRCD